MPPNQTFLAIETSNPLGSVAVGRGDELLAEAAVGVRARHAESLMPAVDFALRSAGVVPRDLGGVVVGGGPGSFTGLRIAAASAKGLVASLDIPLFAYSGLLALAAGLAGGSRAVCALFDARRGEVYAGCYGFPGFERVATILEPVVQPVEAVVEATKDASPVYAGSGALRYRQIIEEGGGTIAPAPFSAPRAAALLWLAALAPGEGRVADAGTWEPDYVRGPSVERITS